MDDRTLITVVGGMSFLMFIACLVVLIANHLQVRSGISEMLSMTQLMKGLALGVKATLESGERLEQTARNVAKDLSDAHERADAVTDGEHGEAADAASQQTQKEKNG